MTKRTKRMNTSVPIPMYMGPPLVVPPFPTDPPSKQRRAISHLHGIGARHGGVTSGQPCHHRGGERHAECHWSLEAGSSEGRTALRRVRKGSATVNLRGDLRAARAAHHRR